MVLIYQLKLITTAFFAKLYIPGRTFTLGQYRNMVIITVGIIQV